MSAQCQRKHLQHHPHLPGAGTTEEEEADRRGKESWETLPSAAESNWGGGIALL